MQERRTGQDRRAVPRPGPDRRRGGRPRLAPGQDTETITVRLPAALLDEACSRALYDQTSVGEVVREALRRLLEGGFVTGN